MLRRRKSELVIYRDGMAQTNGDPIEDIPDAAVAPETPDNVNHPAHYTYGSIEVIDAIEGLALPYHLGNALKYIARAGRKDPAKTGGGSPQGDLVHQLIHHISGETEDGSKKRCGLTFRSRQRLSLGMGRTHRHWCMRRKPPS